MLRGGATLVDHVCQLVVAVHVIHLMALLPEIVLAIHQVHLGVSKQKWSLLGSL